MLRVVLACCLVVACDAGGYINPDPLGMNECPMPCQNGGMCDQGTMECMCVEPWGGMMMDCSEYQGCLSDPCARGQCFNDDGRYVCNCPDQWTGVHCDSYFGCISNPCVRGDCLNHATGDGYYTCDCYLQWGGTHCDQYIGCDSNPCQNGGSCEIISPGNRYECNCVSPYISSHCQDISACASSPCANGGTCQDGSGYSCACVSGWSGSQCMVYAGCDSSPCQNSGQCVADTDSYTCTCSGPWTGHHCHVYTGCDSSPCLNDATCSPSSDDYDCLCVSGFEGQHCESETDECLCSPCIYGSCTDGLASYDCSCSTGWSGTQCDVYAGCYSSPCLNGATCVLDNDRYTCDCVSGFEGFHCESEIDECLCSPCVYGSCIDGLDSYTCACTTGWSGAQCNIYAGCDSSPCLNDGTCSSSNDRYTCSCASGFDGPHCGSEIDECLCSPCLYGTCTDLVAAYNCSCDPGYEGQQCQTETDECSSDPCINGSCTDGINSFSCSCSAGYTGALCDAEVDECSSQPCHNGTCRDESNSFLCDCDDGYNGTLCETDIDECESSPCLTSSCIDGINHFSCNCTAGYEGTQCDEEIDECASSPCINGSCHNLLAQYSCSCDEGYSGPQCEVDVNECFSDPCEQGSCIDQVNAFFCSCNAGFTGDVCLTEIDECLSSPCVFGDCVDDVSNFTCSCTAGYTDSLCSTTIAECLSEPCVNGSCMDLINSYTCLCSAGYTDSHCETEINECLSEPCTNGSCLDLIDGFRCECFPGFSGPLCEDDIDECASSPCHHGDCQDHTNAFSCSCLADYTDELCSLEIDQCLSLPCGNGSCTDLTNAYNCSCFAGFEGEQCQTEIDECSSQPCQHGLCLGSLDTFTCLCNDSYTGLLCDSLQETLEATTEQPETNTTGSLDTLSVPSSDDLTSESLDESTTHVSSTDNFDTMITAEDITEAVTTTSRIVFTDTTALPKGEFKVVCIENNCDHENKWMNSQKEIVFELLCLKNCEDDSRRSLVWVVSNTATDEEVQDLVYHDETLVIPEQAITAPGTYEVSARVDAGSYQWKGSSEFVIIAPPSSGVCSVYPESGETETEFKVSCAGWQSESDILIFALYQDSEKSPEVLIKEATGVNSAEISTSLSEGVPGNGYKTNLKFSIIDTVDQRANYTLSATVIHAIEKTLAIETTESSVTLPTTVGVVIVQNSSTAEKVLNTTEHLLQNDGEGISSEQLSMAKNQIESVLKYMNESMKDLPTQEKQMLGKLSLDSVFVFSETVKQSCKSENSMLSKTERLDNSKEARKLYKETINVIANSHRLGEPLLNGTFSGSTVTLGKVTALGLRHLKLSNNKGSVEFPDDIFDLSRKECLELMMAFLVQSNGPYWDMELGDKVTAVADCGLSDCFNKLKSQRKKRFLNELAQMETEYTVTMKKPDFRNYTQLVTTYPKSPRDLNIHKIYVKSPIDIHVIIEPVSVSNIEVFIGFDFSPTPDDYSVRYLSPNQNIDDHSKYKMKLSKKEVEMESISILFVGIRGIHNKSSEQCFANGSSFGLSYKFFMGGLECANWDEQNEKWENKSTCKILEETEDFLDIQPGQFGSVGSVLVLAQNTSEQKVIPADAIAENPSSSVPAEISPETTASTTAKEMPKPWINNEFGSATSQNRFTAEIILSMARFLLENEKGIINAKNLDYIKMQMKSVLKYMNESMGQMTLTERRNLSNLSLTSVFAFSKTVKRSYNNPEVKVNESEVLHYNRDARQLYRDSLDIIVNAEKLGDPLYNGTYSGSNVIYGKATAVDLKNMYLSTPGGGIQLSDDVFNSGDLDVLNGLNNCLDLKIAFLAETNGPFWDKDSVDRLARVSDSSIYECVNSSSVMQKRAASALVSKIAAFHTVQIKKPNFRQETVLVTATPNPLRGLNIHTMKVTTASDIYLFIEPVSVSHLEVYLGFNSSPTPDSYSRYYISANQTFDMEAKPVIDFVLPKEEVKSNSIETLFVGVRGYNMESNSSTEEVFYYKYFIGGLECSHWIEDLEKWDQQSTCEIVGATDHFVEVLPGRFGPVSLMYVSSTKTNAPKLMKAVNEESLASLTSGYWSVTLLCCLATLFYNFV